MGSYICFGNLTKFEEKFFTFSKALDFKALVKMILDRLFEEETLKRKN
jgi:hypothetical protein